MARKTKTQKDLNPRKSVDDSRSLHDRRLRNTGPGKTLPFRTGERDYETNPIRPTPGHAEHPEDRAQMRELGDLDEPTK